MSGFAQLGEGSGVMASVRNGTKGTIVAGSPVQKKLGRQDGVTCVLPENVYSLSEFAGVVQHDLEYNIKTGDQELVLCTSGVCRANIVENPAVSAVPGVCLLPVSNAGAGYLLPTTVRTGIRLLEDLSALASGAFPYTLGLVEIAPGLVGGRGVHYGWEEAAAAGVDILAGAASSDAAASVYEVADFIATRETPDVPRNVVITPGGTTTDVAAGNVVVEGRDVFGNAITEDFAFLANASTAKTGNRAFASVSKVTIPVQDGAGATWTVEYGAKLGLSRPWGLAQPGPVGVVDGTVEGTAPTVAAHATEVSANTVLFNTAPNGARVHELLLEDF